MSENGVCKHGVHQGELGGCFSCAEAHRPIEQKLEAVRERAVKLTRYPLALVAECSLCGRRTDSFSIHRMDPEPQHEKDCPLWQSK